MESITYSRSVLLCAVQKISTTFGDDIGNKVSGSGTGFWLSTKRGKTVFVTNRHNVDPTMHESSLSSYSFSSLVISLRAFSCTDGLPCGDVNALSLLANDVTIYQPTDIADVVLLSPKTLRAPDNPTYKLVSLQESLMSYRRKPEIFDQLFFVGFPGKLRDKATYDLPIARSCTIASFPEIDYSDEDRTIGSAQTCLVDGLSFSGSSGSVVIRETDGTPELMGIMSGHFKGEKWGESHSGLSYLTRATSILKVIEANGL